MLFYKIKGDDVTMGKKSNLKQGQKKFNFLGRVNLESKGTNVRIDGIADSGYVYNSMKLMLDTGNGNSVKVETFGGYFPEDHARDTLLYLNRENWSDGQVKLDFFKRNKEKIIEQLGIAKSNYLHAGMEFGKGDTYPVAKEFLSEYDLIEYVNEHLHDGDIVSVSGTIEPNIYNGVGKKFIVEYISKRKESVLEKKLANGKTEDELKGKSIDDLFYANFTETLYFTNDSVGRKDKDTGEYPVKAYSVDYLAKIDGKNFKKVKAVPTGYVLGNEKMKKYLTSSRGKVNKVTVDGRIINKSQEKKLSYDELDEDVRSLIDDGLITKEDAIGKATVFGGFISKRYIDMITIYTKKDDDGNVKQDVQYFKDFADSEELFDMVLDVDEPEIADLNEDYNGEDEDIIDSIDEDTEEDADLEDILAGL